MSSGEHTCCNLNIQRDLYSAFLAGSIVENKLDTADPEGFRDWRSTEAVLQRAVSELKQVATGRQLPSSFGLRIGDRATRLRSSDADSVKVKPSGKRIPDAKGRSRFAGSRESGDVVAVQLWLF